MKSTKTKYCVEYSSNQDIILVDFDWLMHITQDKKYDYPLHRRLFSYDIGDDAHFTKISTPQKQWVAEINPHDFLPNKDISQAFLLCYYFLIEQLLPSNKASLRQFCENTFVPLPHRHFNYADRVNTQFIHHVLTIHQIQDLIELVKNDYYSWEFEILSHMENMLQYVESHYQEKGSDFQLIKQFISSEQTGFCNFFIKKWDATLRHAYRHQKCVLIVDAAFGPL